MEASMKTSQGLFVMTSVVLATFYGQPLLAKDYVAGPLHDACDVLETLPTIPAKCIPPSLLLDAQGVAIIPKVLKIGLGVGARYGEGVVLARNPDGTWSNPVFVCLTGGSVGWQAGVASTDVVLVFKTRKSVERLLQGKGKITLGADVAVAAGPVGRQAEAATDARLQAEIYSYSRSRGLFGGIALEGAAILNYVRANEQFMHTPRREDIMAAEKLKALLAVLSGVPVRIVNPPNPHFDHP
jgi:lipid-binding SYLF domain-containing protein